MASAVAALLDNFPLAYGAAHAAVACFAISMEFESVTTYFDSASRAFIVPIKYGLSVALETCIVVMLAGVRESKYVPQAMNAVLACFGYALLLVGVMAASDGLDPNFTKDN